LYFGRTWCELCPARVIPSRDDEKGVSVMTSYHVVRDDEGYNWVEGVTVIVSRRPRAYARHWRGLWGMHNVW